jgi:signal transduction histidine kinase
MLLNTDAISEGNSRNNVVIRKEIVEIIVRNAKRLRRLTEDILDVTRIEGKTLKLNKQRLFIARTLREMIKDYAGFNNSNKGLALSFFTSKKVDSIQILADENRIKQVIANLVDNAIKFTEEGMISVSVEISPRHNCVVVKVKDSGSGIDKEIFPRIFTKFATKSDTTGTGLGLFIAKSIVGAHGGKIGAEDNRDGRGAILHLAYQ